LFGFVIDIIFYGFVVQHMPSVLGAVGKLARETKKQKKHNSIEYDASYSLLLETNSFSSVGTMADCRSYVILTNRQRPSVLITNR